MTQKEKQLLLKDLCARLPYGLKVKCERYQFPVTVLYAGNLDEVKFGETGGIEHIGLIKPYLRPMSSMTDEEESMYNLLQGISHSEQHWTADDGKVCRYADAMDFLLEYHFDYRGLIEKGLALEAPEGMYKTEKI